MLTLCGRCTGLLMALNHARHVIPNSTLTSIVQALVISAVRYCMSVYGSCSDTQVHRIQKMINFCARVVSGRKRRDQVSDVVQRLGWMTAKQLIEYHTVSAVHTAVTTGHPESISQTIGLPANQRHAHETRRAHRLTVPRIDSEAGRRRLCYRSVIMLNEAKVDVSDPHFRLSLKKNIMSRPIE